MNFFKYFYKSSSKKEADNKESLSKMSTESTQEDIRVFDLETIKLSDPGVEKIDTLRGVYTWLDKIYQLKQNTYDSSDKKTNIIIDKTSINILPDSIISDKIDVTHGGLIDYVFNAWAKELGVVLSPDVLFFTVISEIKDYIVANSEKFQKIFTVSDKKETLILNEFTVEKLVDVLSELIPSKELFKIINETSFSTQPEYFKQVLGITFADMATPYYDYCKSKCGIPKVVVTGKEIDWNNLYLTIRELNNILTPYSKVMKLYLERVTNTIFELIEAIFSNNDTEFFRTMFIYGDDPQKCMSGHDSVILTGWLRNFYIGDFYENKHYGWENYISNFPSHLNVLPYTNKDDPNNHKYCFYVCGLSSSKIVDDCLYPTYNIAHCEIIHSDKKHIFNTIASIKKEEK